ncbi:MAG: WG repeat-containing protein [Saprospiraceae bacterium]|nr:WG repeat-containing protein [Saprospiraceae bacterium]
MKRTTLLYLLLILGFSKTTAQRLEYFLIPFEENGKWGYMDCNHTVVVEPKFEAAFPTYDLRGLIKLKGKYGYIDHTGKLVIKAKYREATEFMFGRAKVKIGKKEFWIDTKGERPKQGVALCGGIYRNCLVPLDTPRLVFEKDGKYGFAFEAHKRVDGKLIQFPDTVQAVFDSIKSIDHQLTAIFQNGKMAIFHDGVLCGYSERKDTLFDFKYNALKMFKTYDDDYPKCFDSEIGVRKDDKWGYISFRGYAFHQYDIEPKYVSIGQFRSELAKVEYAPDKFGYIDSAGHEYFKRE